MTVKRVLDGLKANLDLKYLVGSRIYRSRIPQNPTYPLIMFNVSRETNTTLSGSTGVYNYDFVFELYGKDYDTLEDVAEKLKAAIDGSSVFKGVCTAEADDTYTDANNNYSIFLDYSIWF